jgi:hypothetical protein
MSKYSVEGKAVKMYGRKKNTEADAVEPLEAKFAELPNDCQAAEI